MVGSKVKPALPAEAAAARRQAAMLVGAQYKNWDVVWARMVGFPWWPGVVFHGWDVVEAAGLPLPAGELPAIAAPETREVAVVSATGKVKKRVVTDRFCIVMFLDKGNWCAANMNTQVMPFTLGFRANSNPPKSVKKANTAGFRLAVQRAIRLLHTSHECSEADLAMLNAPPPPPPQKKKRQRHEPAASRRTAESDWEDNAESSERSESEDDAVFVKRAPPAAKPEAKAPAKKQAKAPAAAAKRAPKQTQKSAGRAKAGSKSAPAKKRAPARTKKAERNSSDGGGGGSEDTDGDDGSDGGSEESAGGDVEVIEHPAAQKPEGGDDASAPASTPLSHIWTEHVEDDSASGEASKTLVYKQDFVWDDALFTTNDEVVVVKKDPLEQHGSPTRDRPLGKRQMRSVQQSHIRQNLMMGNLDPHTMVQCEAYRSKDEIENPMNRSRGSSNLEAPFQVQVHPDAAFVCDLHAHLATCEIIGFLGGRWNEVTKTLYIQAAFPCRSLMIDGDDGSTDVEMDPGSEIELREIIQNAELEVVGWYHSHPAFAPDPSIRDIENQTSYQQLFQRRTERQLADGQKPSVEISEPFVGLIVGTYDTKRDTPVSLFRYFHTRGEKVSGGARREIYMPYELVPTRRHYRAVLRAERRAEVSTVTMYPSVCEALFGKQSGGVRLHSAEVPIDHPQIEFGGIDPSPATGSSQASSTASATEMLDGDIGRFVDLSGPAKPESPESSGSSQASSTTSASGMLDGVVGITGGRRRGRKPVQTQRKVTTFTSQSTKTDDPSLATHTSSASQFAVYDAFGTVSGVSAGALPDRKDASIQTSIHADQQTVVNLESSATDQQMAVDLESRAGSQKSEVESPLAAVAESLRLEGISDAVSSAVPPGVEAMAEVLQPPKVEIVAVKGDGGAEAETRKDADMAETSHGAKEQVPAVARVLLFGRDRQAEDIRTSLAGIEAMVARMKDEQRRAAAVDAKSPVIRVVKDADAAGDGAAVASSAPAIAENGESEPTAGAKAADVQELSDAARQEARLLSLRTKYGSGISGCAEQAITLVDYYCKFERRIDLNETWKTRVSKLSKIEASMSEYVRYVNVPAHLRQDFVEDVMAYLELSWRLQAPAWRTRHIK